MTKKNSTVKTTPTLKHTKHATTRASKKREKEMESNEEEEEGINEDIVVVINQKESMVRNNKMNEQISNKVVGKVNNLDLNGANKKKTFQTTLSKKQINREKSNTSSMEGSESGTESSLD